MPRIAQPSVSVTSVLEPDGAIYTWGTLSQKLDQRRAAALPSGVISRSKMRNILSVEKARLPSRSRKKKEASSHAPLRTKVFLDVEDGHHSGLEEGSGWKRQNPV